jgi:hypothetical protein
MIYLSQGRKEGRKERKGKAGFHVLNVFLYEDDGGHMMDRKRS